MKREHTELLERIEGYSPDDPDAAFPFSARLARDNAWSPAFAALVVREYKRFAFLAMAAGHPVTPSDEVDQAWHLHMLYTRSYWDDFCRGVLGGPLHHSPTRGGGREQGKFVDWYARTLDSYRRFFGEEPPEAVWPESRKRFGEDIRFVRVNTERNWVLAKPAWWRWTARRLRDRARPRVRAGADGLRSPAVAAAVGVGLVAALGGCRELLADGFVMPSVSGPDFLFGTVVAGAVGLALAGALRVRLANGPAGPPAAAVDDGPSDPYALAYLSGKADHATDALVAGLVEGGFLRANPNEHRLVRSATPPETVGLHPLERGVYELVGAGVGTRVKDVREVAEGALEPVRDGLRLAGWTVGPDRARRAVAYPLLVALVVPLGGVLRVIHGLGQDKPVGFLFGLVLLLGAIAFVGFGRAPHRTRHGDRVLGELKRRHRRLRRGGAPATELPLAVGLFGLATLNGSAHADLVTTLKPEGDHSGGSAGGGCSGGGCGGGGCGGCGGGGCGGCGG